jgi:hypothetical protein
MFESIKRDRASEIAISKFWILATPVQGDRQVAAEIRSSQICHNRLFLMNPIFLTLGASIFSGG